METNENLKKSLRRNKSEELKESVSKEKKSSSLLKKFNDIIRSSSLNSLPFVDVAKPKSLIELLQNPPKDEQIIIELITKADPEELNSTVDERKSRNALHWAVLCSHPNSSQIVELLITKGMSTELKDKSHQTPLLLVMNHRDDEYASHIINILIKQGANSRVTDDKLRTACHLAAMSGYYQNLFSFLKTIKEYKAFFDENSCDQAKRTPLQYLLEVGSFAKDNFVELAQACLLLIQKGCRINFSDSEGMRSLLLATHVDEKLLESMKKENEQKKNKQSYKITESIIELQGYKLEFENLLYKSRIDLFVIKLDAILDNFKSSADNFIVEDFDLLDNIQQLIANLKVEDIKDIEDLRLNVSESAKPEMLIQKFIEKHTVELIAKSFLEKIFDIYQGIKNTSKWIFQAIREAELKDIIVKLIENADVFNLRDHENKTIVHCAAKYKRFDLLDFLESKMGLQWLQAINHADNLHKTVLEHLFYYSSDPGRELKLKIIHLIEIGAKVDFNSEDIIVILNTACINGYREQVIQLLKNQKEELLRNDLIGSLISKNESALNKHSSPKKQANFWQNLKEENKDGEREIQLEILNILKKFKQFDKDVAIFELSTTVANGFPGLEERKNLVSEHNFEFDSVEFHQLIEFDHALKVKDFTACRKLITEKQIGFDDAPIKRKKQDLYQFYSLYLEKMAELGFIKEFAQQNFIYSKNEKNFLLGYENKVNFMHCVVFKFCYLIKNGKNDKLKSWIEMINFINNEKLAINFEIKDNEGCTAFDYIESLKDNHEPDYHNIKNIITSANERYIKIQELADAAEASDDTVSQVVSPYP